jgi:tetratricopeptide (TPR) repeat protein
MRAQPSSVVVPRTASPAMTSTLYMFSPAVDLGVIAGGLTFILFPLSLLFASQLNVAGFLVLLFFCNYPHYMATLHRIYRTRAQIERYKVFSIYLTGLLVLTALLGHLMAAVWVKVLYTVYFTWSPFHYTGQNYGISLMYLRRGGTQPSNGERWLLYLAFIACFLMYATAINTDIGIAPVFPFHSLGIPRPLGRAVFLALLAVAIVCGGAFLWQIVRRAAGQTLVPVLLLMGSQFAWFAAATGVPMFATDLGLQWLPIEGLFPVIAFLHCAQYLGVTAYYAKRDRMSEQREFSVLRYLAVLILGAVFLWIGTTRVLSQAFALDYGISFFLMLSLINIHHFLMDGAIWKLRDGRLAQLLLAPERPLRKTEVAPTAQSAQKREGRGGLRSPTEGAGRGAAWRPLAWGLAAAAALVLAGTDLYYRYGIWQANQASQAGDGKGAVEFYSAVWGINGRASEALDGLAFWSLKAGRVQQAADAWEQSIKLNPTETSAYAHIGLGEVYLRLGRIDEAMRQLETAIAYRPDEPSSYILMARAYDRQGDAAKAEEMRRRAQQASPSKGGARRLLY